MSHMSPTERARYDHAKLLIKMSDFPGEVSYLSMDRNVIYYFMRHPQQALPFGRTVFNKQRRYETVDALFSAVQYHVNKFLAESSMNG